jgi:hypothetical protein
MSPVLEFAAYLGVAQVFAVLIVVNLRLRNGGITNSAAIRAVTTSIVAFALLVAIVSVAKHFD